MVTVVRGDVILCDLNPVVGTEQAGVRPTLVVQIDRANTVSPHTIIAPFTTRIRRAVLPSHALIPAGVGGLTHDSVVLCEQIRVIDKRRIIPVLGHVDDIYMEEVARALRTILGLEAVSLERSSAEEYQAAAESGTAPNKGLELTASSVRSCLAVRRNSSNCIPDESG